MESIDVGELVTVGGGAAQLHGIVFDKPSKSKVVIAVVDPARGPVFRTVHPGTLIERTKEAPDDRALQLLIRRTPPPVQSTAAGGAGPGRGSRGHTRRAMHRTTGK